MYFTAALIFAMVIIFLIKDKTIQKSLIEPDDIYFGSKKSVKVGVPNTIIFNYNVKKYPTDDIFIQLSWNPKEREQVTRTDSFYTTTYYYPGFHHAKLIIGDKIVKEHDIHITTNGWFTLVRMNPDDVIPIFIRNKDVINDGIIYASPYMLKLNNVDLTANEFFVSYFNVKEFRGVHADNFSFETEIKNSAEELALICQNCRIFIYAEKGTIVIPISTKGCVSDIGIVAGSVYESGKRNDLSGLGCDLTKWRKVGCKVKNNLIRIFIDKKEVYQLAYTNPFGKIKGWHYFFKGCGAVNYLTISDSTNTEIFHDSFD